MIECKHDVIVALPPGAFKKPMRGAGWLNNLRRFTGFGRTIVVKKIVTDINNDGRTILQVSCPKGVEAMVRRANGARVSFIDANEHAKDVKLDIAGEITVTFKEVRNGNI